MSIFQVADNFMTLDEKINQLNKWEEEGILTEEHKEKFDKIFDIFESAKDMIKDVQKKKEYCEQYMKTLDKIEKDQLEAIKNAYKHFDSTYEIVEKELTEDKQVENTNENKVSKEDFLAMMQDLFNSWQ